MLFISLGTLLVCLVNVLFSIAPGISLVFFLKIASWICAFLLSASWGRDEEVRKNLPLIYLLGGVGVGTVGFLLWIPMASHAPGTMTSTFYESDVYSGYLLLLIPMAASYLAFSKDLPRRLMHSGVLILLLFSLFFTYSRGGIFVFLATLIIAAFVLYFRKLRSFKCGFIIFSWVMFFCFAFFFMFGRHAAWNPFWVKASYRQSWQTAVEARLSFWRGGIQIFKEHPVWGSGIDTFGWLFPKFQEHFFWYSRYPHNFYIQTLSDGGLVLFAFMVCLLAFVLNSGLRVVRGVGDRSLKVSKLSGNDNVSGPVPNENFYLALGLFLGFIGGLLHLFVDVDSNFLLWSTLFWSLAGLLVSLDSRKDWKPLPISGSLFIGFLFFSCLVLQIFILRANHFDQTAKTLELKGNVQGALSQERLAARLFPLNGSYLEYKAHLELIAGLYAAACQDFEKAMKLEPKRPLFLAEYAKALLQKSGNEKRAEHLFQEALKLDPLNYPAYRNNLADLKFSSGKFLEAKKIYDNVVSLYPEEDLSRLHFFRRGDFQQALALAHLGLANVAFQQNDEEKAKAEVRQALKIDEDNPKINHVAGLLALNQRDWQKAKTFFEKAVAGPELKAQSWKWLAFSDLKSREIQKALKSIQKAIMLDPKDPEAFTIAADIYNVEGNKQEAQKMLKSASTLK